MDEGKNEEKKEAQEKPDMPPNYVDGIRDEPEAEVPEETGEKSRAGNGPEQANSEPGTGGKKAGLSTGLIAIFMAALLVVGFVMANLGIITQLAGKGNTYSGSTYNSYTYQTGGSQDSGGAGGSGGSANSNYVVATVSGSEQVVNMEVNRYGYTPKSIVLKKGVKVKWVINVTELTGCNREIIVRDYGLDIKLHEGQNIVEFTPDKEGAFRFTCGMGMIRGTFIVVNDLSDQSAINKAVASAPKPSSGGSGGTCSH